MDHATCKSCGEAITWLRTKSGKNIPVDPDSIKQGDTIYNRAQHTCHFDTCANKPKGKTAPKEERRPDPEPIPEINLDADEPAPF